MKQNKYNFIFLFRMHNNKNYELCKYMNSFFKKFLILYQKRDYN